MIEFESVSKTFRDGTTAVDGLSLVVPSGQITVIVGPSGCGKTTTLRMVNRMLEPSKGKITWDDKPIKSRRKTTLRRQMGYVIQSGGLFPHRTVLENIATVPELLRWDKQKSRKRAAELLGSVGLDRKLGNRYPAQLSGGQQQRVGVARALAADPLVLLMDEPFSAVDPVVRSELHEFFLGLQRELSKTIIMITHDIDEAIKLGDQVAILRVGGKLAQVGAPQQLLDEPADAFVEGFVGRDRGYRSLSFQPASGLSLGHVQVVRDAGYAGGDGPVLVVDADAQPVGWADPSRPGTAVALGATFDPENDSLRTALDAALTSPVGLAVAVTGDPRRYAGVVDADMILRQVTQARAQVAESIAVRAHDEDEQPYVESAPAGEQPYDPDATSVREPVRESVPSESEPAADGPDDPEATRVTPAAADWDGDPDATRVAGPLFEDEVAESDHETVESGHELPESGDELPESDHAAPESGHQTPELGHENPEFSDETSEPGVETSEVSGETSEVSGEASVSGGNASELSEQEGAPEAYGAEAPATEDETVATAYDAQLAQDDVLADREWQSAAEDESAPQTQEPQTQEAQTQEPQTESPDPEESDTPPDTPEHTAPDSQEPDSQEPAALDDPESASSDEHDREPPR